MDEKKYPQRKSPRLKGYDYSSSNAYLITINAYHHRLIFGRIIPGDELNPSVCELSQYGEIAKQELLNLERRYPHFTLDNYVIMPNHIHALVSLHETGGQEPRADVPAIVCAFKSLTAKRCRQIGYSDRYLFQASFNDQIIRDEGHYQNTWHYIDINPAKWTLDRYYKER